MSNVVNLNYWDDSLCFQLNNNNSSICDFNRFLYKGFPSTKDIKHGNSVSYKDRKDIASQFKDCFKEKINEGASHDTLYSLYIETSRYLKWCDQNNSEAFKQSSLEGYFDSLLERVNLGTLKRNTYTNKLSCMSMVFKDYLDLPSQWFLNVTSAGKGDKESFEAYSRRDLKQLLPLLKKLFDQTAKQFLENPQKHINAHNNVSTMTFHWQGKEYPLCAAISKMMCAAAYLLSYYTYSNTGIILNLKRPHNASTSLGEEWYTMPAFKRRAFKIIHVEIGEHEYLDIPKYCINFFDKLLEVSCLLNSKDDLLFHRVAYKNVKPMIDRTLNDFCRTWLDKQFKLTDQTGRRLRPVISRFRETGAQLTTYYQGELANNIMLGNTPQTRKRSYSEGNKHQNNGMMQDAAAIRQEQAEKKKGAKAAQKSLNIDVLTIEEEYKINIPELSRTPNGSSCATPFGEKSERYNRRAKKHNLLKEGERLACADLLECFGCTGQVIVQSVSDIWCLISFRDCIEESLYLHLDAHHYRHNFEDVVTFIDNNILPNIKKNILKKAELKLNDEGRHPIWDDSESILSLIPKTEKIEGEL